jgi:hypothetical protein
MVNLEQLKLELKENSFPEVQFDRNAYTTLQPEVNMGDIVIFPLYSCTNQV